jgi:hypothetical protein
MSGPLQGRLEGIGHLLHGHWCALDLHAGILGHEVGAHHLDGLQRSGLGVVGLEELVPDLEHHLLFLGRLASGEDQGTGGKAYYYDKKCFPAHDNVPPNNFLGDEVPCFIRPPPADRTTTGKRSER